MEILSDAAAAAGRFVGRVWRPEASGPSVVLLRGGRLIDITNRETPTMRDLMAREDLPAYLDAAEGEDIGALAEIAAASVEPGPAPQAAHLLSPVDLQAVKACGVTFARSTIERVIEEQADGDPAKADAIRQRVGGVIGESLRDLVPGSDKAMQVKAMLIEEGLWSQYLEVGIGPDAEVFTKAQAMSSVGWGASVGLHPMSSWNNPEPELVLIVDPKGVVKGATLGNDLNLRDVEGRSALLLGRAKDNNASAALGPFIRVLDDGYGVDDLRRADIHMTVEGPDGFILRGESALTEISRDPLDLVSQTISRNHQYPDGFALYLGTLFAPTEDRDAPGEGFTHKLGDVTTIRNDDLGALVNTVRLSTECPEWTFGTGALMRNLAGRGLL